MRALSIQRVLVPVAKSWFGLVPWTFSVRRIHNTPVRYEEVSTPENPTPRKRGRPKKLPEEHASKVQVTENNPVISNAVSTTKPVKAKKAPKISDISRLIPPSILSPHPARPLRPYQEECIDACLDAISEGIRRLGISLATGAGKTVIFTNLIGKVQLEDTKRYQTIILVHRRELVEQAARHCVESYPDKVRSHLNLN
jgi:hypothetical protein